MNEEQVKKYEGLREVLHKAQNVGVDFHHPHNTGRPQSILSGLITAEAHNCLHDSCRDRLELIKELIIELKNRNIEAWRKEIEKI